MCMHKQGAEQREKEKQASHWAGSVTRSSIPGPRQHDPSQRQTSNQPRHQGALVENILKIYHLQGKSQTSLRIMFYYTVNSNSLCTECPSVLHQKSKLPMSLSISYLVKGLPRATKLTLGVIYQKKSSLGRLGGSVTWASAFDSGHDPCPGLPAPRGVSLPAAPPLVCCLSPTKFKKKKSS